LRVWLRHCHVSATCSQFRTLTSVASLRSARALVHLLRLSLSRSLFRSARLFVCLVADTWLICTYVRGHVVHNGRQCLALIRQQLPVRTHTEQCPAAISPPCRVRAFLHKTAVYCCGRKHSAL